MTLLQAAILGVVEGISEFLPISSTAHLILASSLMRIPETDFVKSFEIAIQLGAILSIVVLYGKTFLRGWRTWSLLLTAFLPTAVIGLLLHSVVKRFLLGNVPVVLWSLFLGGIALIVFERLHRESDAATDDLEKITYKQAALIGLFQSIAIIPGVSRSAATIVGGLLLGIKRRTIIDFSFMLAVPTMAAATALDLLKSSAQFTGAEFGLLGVGFLMSFVVALASVLWLLRFLRSHTFISFGIYRIALALAFVGAMFLVPSIL